jgi:hypothetical protein
VIVVGEAFYYLPAEATSEELLSLDEASYSSSEQ